MAAQKPSTSRASDRMRVALNREQGFKELDQVVLKNSRLDGLPWSFKDHEYQIEIIKDTKLRQAIRKCSQVGASELFVHKGLALLSVMQHMRMIYSLPTKEMASLFSKDRFDGAISQSDFYSGLMSAGENSATQKKLGTCILYVVGTFGSKSAISVPAEIVMSDEVDFSNDAVLGKLNSRIRHAKITDEHDNRGMRVRFSTPTFDGFGIDKDFQAGDQKYYMCRCEHCEHWVLPSYDEDFVIPGYDGKMINFAASDARDERNKLGEAWLKCPHCSKDLFSSLIQPERRMWVAKRPDVWDSSYQVSPWDVPKYNTPAAIIKQFDDYPLKSDFYNFVLGLPYSDAENTFTTTNEHRDKYCNLDLWIYQSVTAQGLCVGGTDVGKTCHFNVKVKVHAEVWHVVWMEKIPNTKLSPAAPALIARFDYYRLQKMCVDAGPDISLVNALVAARQGILAVNYVNSVAGLMPVAYGKDDVINADRTKTLKMLLEAHNSGDMYYPKHEALQIELFNHLKTTKKLRERNADGVMTERFVKDKKDDHWVHSLNYSSIAVMVLEHLEGKQIAAAAPMVGTVRMGAGGPSTSPSGSSSKSSSHHLHGLFGVSGKNRW